MHLRFIDLLDRADRFQLAFSHQIDRFYKFLKPIYILYALFVLHFISVSGSIYNMITNAPPYGQGKNLYGGETIKFFADGTNFQYSTEGFLAGIIICVASWFFIKTVKLLHSRDANLSQFVLYSGIGVVCCLVLHWMYRMKQ